jgi:ABC-type transporter Mla MlaB component
MTLSGELTVPYARDLHSALHQAVRQTAEIVVVLERVTGVDVTFPQLLCSAHRTAAALRKNLTVIIVSAGPVVQLLQDLGFQRRSGCGGINGPDCLWRIAGGQGAEAGAGGHERS